MKNVVVLFVLFLLISCCRSGRTSPASNNTPVVVTPASRPKPVTVERVREEDIVLLCTPGPIPDNLVENESLLYLRKEFVAKIFSSPAGQDELFKLELPFMGAGKNKKVFYINQNKKVFCQKHSRSRDAVGDNAKQEEFVKTVMKQILENEFHQR
ncbi:hypothetical protein BH09BAC4_BH09BAC4_06160 [soil metagenome]